MGASPAAHFCGLFPFDPLRCEGDIPIFPELFYDYYPSKKHLPFCLDVGLFPFKTIYSEDLREEMQRKQGQIILSQNLSMLDKLESVIGERDKSCMYDGEGLCSRWLEALDNYGPDAFRSRVLDLFPDFQSKLAGGSQGFELLCELLRQHVTLNRRNLARILGLLHGRGTIEPARKYLDDGISFTPATAGEIFIAFPEDLYGYLKQRIPDDIALQIALGISGKGSNTVTQEMKKAKAYGVPAGYLRRIESLSYLNFSVENYGHAAEFLRLVWYYENYPEEYRYLFKQPILL